MDSRLRIKIALIMAYALMLASFTPGKCGVCDSLSPILKGTVWYYSAVAQGAKVNIGTWTERGTIIIRITSADTVGDSLYFFYSQELATKHPYPYCLWQELKPGSSRKHVRTSEGIFAWNEQNQGWDVAYHAKWFSNCSDSQAVIGINKNGKVTYTLIDTTGLRFPDDTIQFAAGIGLVKKTDRVSYGYNTLALDSTTIDGRAVYLSVSPKPKFILKPSQINQNRIPRANARIANHYLCNGQMIQSGWLYGKFSSSAQMRISILEGNGQLSWQEQHALGK